MFGSRRHRPPSQPLTAATANPNAASAAASAFSRQTSSSSLSSAAAAAALKARPHTPTNVSEVQTRRTRRRSASVSSAGSRDGGSGLKRSPSVGSMSERSLRSTSPHRPAARKPAEEPPPVPSIPDYAVGKSNGDARERNTHRHTQSSSLGSDAAKAGGLSWFVPPSTDPPQRIRTSHDSDARPRSSGSSINFSYPRGARVASPTPNSPSADKPMSRLSPTLPSTTESAEGLVYDPNSRRMISKSESLALEQSLKGPRRKSTRKKKKRTSAPSSDSGAGSVSRPEKPAEGLGPFEAPELVTDSVSCDKDAELFMEPKTKANESLQSSALALPKTHHEGARATPSPSRQVLDHSRYQAYRPPAARVHEISGSVKHYQDASRVVDTVPVNTSTHTDNRGPVELPAEHVDKTSQVESPGQSSPEPDKIDSWDSKEAPTAHKTVSIAPKEKLAVPVRHSPPPRATSPIKSALKHPVGSNRTSSVSDYGSEASADVIHQHLDPAVARKKSVRVSFDDESVILGEASVDDDASEDARKASLPVTKKRWYSLPKRRNSGASIEGGVDEEVMKPRPMLPSFGSIREKKAKPHEERPLVRPHAFASSPPPAHLPTIPSDSDLGRHGASFSSDHAIGTALTNDLAHRHEANTSRLREPLPPQVTSVEGDGLMSDDSSDASLLNSEDEEQQEPLSNDAPNAVPAPAAPESDVIHTESSASDTKGEDNKSAINSHPKPASNIGSTTSVPQIAVLGPSPQPKEGDVPDSPQSPESEEFFEVPGTFPEKNGADTEASVSWSPPQIIKSWWWGTKPESGSVQSEASKLPAEKAEISPDPKSGSAHELPSTIEEESEESGVFSDAYEDLSDIEEDGFQSLAAVAAQPVRSEASQEDSDQATPFAVKEAKEPKEITKTSGSAEASALVKSAPEETPSMDWEQAKAYWRSLSAEKRRQLELEAMLEAGIEADLDELNPPAKPKKKKSVKEQSKPENGLLAGSSTKSADVGQGGRLRKTLRGSRPGSSDGVVTSAQQQPERQGMLRSLRSPPPAAPSEASSQGGMRKSLRTQQSPDFVSTESPRLTEKRPLSLPTPTLSLPQKLRAKSNKRPMSSGETPQGPGTTDWTASLPQRRGSFSSESSFKRSTPRPGSSGFRKTMRSGADSPGMVPGSSAGKMGSFSLRSSSPPHGTFRRHSSFGSSPSASPASMMRRGSNGGGWRHRRLFSFKGFSKKGGKQSARDLDDSSDEDVAAELPSSPTRLRRPGTANGATPTKATPTPVDGVFQEQAEELPGSDSEHDQIPAADPATSPSANGSLSHSRSGRGSQSKPDRKGKAGLMSALRRRKADQGRISRPERTESAARRDTKLERSAAELEALRSPAPGRGDRDEDDDSVEVSLPSPRRKLEKRGGPAGAGIESPEGKKKKFSALRRVLKMDE